MTISELIESLLAVEAEYGDLPVLVGSRIVAYEPDRVIHYDAFAGFALIEYDL